MRVGIEIRIVWFDDDAIGLWVHGSNGDFSGGADVYISHDDLTKIGNTFRGFPDSANDHRELLLGNFDPGYAGGGVIIRLFTMNRSGHVAIGFRVRTDPNYSSESAEFSIFAEPTAIDDFVDAVSGMALAVGSAAYLRGQVADPFTLLTLSLADFPAILEVYRQCEDFLALGPAPRASLEMVRADFEASRRAGRRFLGISVENRLAGVLDYLPSGFEGHPEQAFIEFLMIARPYRRQGLGRAVVAWFEEQIRQDDQVRAILLGVQVNNPAGLSFWQRCGYAIAGEPELQPDGTTGRLLRKNLI